jgi:glycosyltransferase (activator-dependent family)
MRVLITVWPTASHLFPVIPLAWALQGAGHEVRVASPPNLWQHITAAGLTAVPLGDEESTPGYSGEYVTLPQEERDRLARELGLGPQDAHEWEMFSVFLVTAVEMFHQVPREPGARVPLVDDLVAHAREWQPDLVLWDTWPAAAVAARSCGAAHARLLWGADITGWALERFARADARGEEPLANPLREVVRPVAERYGFAPDDELLLGQWTVDPTPPELHLPVPGRRVQLRWVPYTGGAVVPEWLYPVPKRPRVALTLGTTAQMFDYANHAMLAAMLDTVAELDIEVVATLTPGQLAELAVPDNVRVVDYIPLGQLLPTCAALIHHGGFGSFATAVAHEVPQLIEMGAGVESPEFARSLTGARAGLTVHHERDGAAGIRERLTRLLTEPEFAAGARKLHADWLALPSPNDVVPVLEKLTVRHRARS